MNSLILVIIVSVVFAGSVFWVGYCNGVRVERDNAPEAPAKNLYFVLMKSARFSYILGAWKDKRIATMHGKQEEAYRKGKFQPCIQNWIADENGDYHLLEIDL